MKSVQEKRVEFPQRGIHWELAEIARLAYIYGFPSYQMARLRFQALKQRYAGLNILYHRRVLTTPVTGRISNTNADMLKSSAWIDLSRGPLVVHVPDTKERYYSLALMDFFTNNFAVLGQRSNETATGNFLLAGPGWAGAVPKDMTLVRAPTNAIWALARILVYGTDDLKAVNALQDQFTISRSGLSPEAMPPNPHPLSIPVPTLHDNNLLMFFDILNAVLTENAPPARDNEILNHLRMIDVGPSLRFDRRRFSQPQREALQKGISAARDVIRVAVDSQVHASRNAAAKHWRSDVLLARLRRQMNASLPRNSGRQQFGWSRPAAAVGDFGTSYLLRARCALRGIGGLPREDAMYFIASTDATGERLGSGRCYVLRFPQGGLPPVDAYWSLTAYQTDSSHRAWLVPNQKNRYSIGSHTPGLHYGSHGSLEILIQHERPTVNEENWLPAPEGEFLLTLRTYLPRREMLEGIYAIPAVQRRSGPQ
jgi:hypothetical protein